MIQGLESRLSPQSKTFLGPVAQLTCSSLPVTQFTYRSAYLSFSLSVVQLTCRSAYLLPSLSVTQLTSCPAYLSPSLLVPRLACHITILNNQSRAEYSNNRTGAEELNMQTGRDLNTRMRARWTRIIDQARRT